MARLPRRLNIQTDQIEPEHITLAGNILERLGKDGGNAAADFSLHIQVSWLDAINEREVEMIRRLRSQSLESITRG